MKDLTNSSIERKNILNNNQAIEEIYKNLGFYGLMFENKYRFTKNQIAKYFDVDTRTIDRILENNKEELVNSGYEVYNGIKLKQFKDHILFFLEKEDGNDIDVVTIKQIYESEIDSLSKTSILGTFTYKAFLNIGMLLTDSENAQRLRSVILDIVIDFLNKKIGGKTKFINQREEEFIPSAIREYNYRQEFTNCLDHYIADNKFKYAQLTDKIYKSIFKEDAKEYRQILNLNSKESVRSTLYSEVLDLIASYENGFSDFLKREFNKLNRKLTLSEAHLLFKEYDSIMNSTLLPLKEKARSLMASRDLVFRDALHEKLRDYISEVSAEDFEKFLGENSKSLEERLEENKDVFIRLKDR